MCKVIYAWFFLPWHFVALVFPTLPRESAACVHSRLGSSRDVCFYAYFTALKKHGKVAAWAGSVENYPTPPPPCEGVAQGNRG